MRVGGAERVLAEDSGVPIVYLAVRRAKLLPSARPGMAARASAG